MVICLERGAHLHTAQLMPLPLTISCSSKIQIDFTFLVPAHLGCPGQRAIKRVCVCYFNGGTSCSLQISTATAFVFQMAGLEKTVCTSASTSPCAINF